MNPKRQETKGYLGSINSLGGQSQAELVHMGRVAEPETLSKTESQMRKSLELRFDKDSEGYLLYPSLHAA